MQDGCLIRLQETKEQGDELEDNCHDTGGGQGVVLR